MRGNEKFGGFIKMGIHKIELKKFKDLPKLTQEQIFKENPNTFVYPNDLIEVIVEN